VSYSAIPTVEVNKLATSLPYLAAIKKAMLPSPDLFSSFHTAHVRFSRTVVTIFLVFNYNVPELFIIIVIMLSALTELCYFYCAWLKGGLLAVLLFPGLLFFST